MTSPLTLRALFLIEHLDLSAASGVPDAQWEAFQLRHLCDDSLFRIETKSRQIAWSWLTAAEALADAILDQRDSIFVSINQDEAKEKLRYAKTCLEALPPHVRPSLKRDNDLSLELANGARLISLPARPPRGKARCNVYLDEFAHTAKDRAIYTAALPVVSKGGRLRIGSSPLGASGMFWEVATEALRPYPDYMRVVTPWWHVRAFCTNVRGAKRHAPALMTEERVARFGTERLQRLYANMLPEDFQQEYEATVVDEATAWISWDDIRAAQHADLDCTALKATTHVQSLGDLAPILASLRGTPLYVGVDIGRTRNTTEIYAVSAEAGLHPLRLSISLDNIPFDDQAWVLRTCVTTATITKMLIDRNGLGMHLAETLSTAYPAKVEGVDFTNETKKAWATHAKMIMQQRKAALPADRDLAYQIHSIKRIVTPSKNMVFDTERNEKHHADKFWAWALALHAASHPHPFQSIVDYYTRYAHAD